MTSRKKSNDESQQNSHRSKPPDGRKRGLDRAGTQPSARAYSDGRTGGYGLRSLRILEAITHLTTAAAFVLTVVLVSTGVAEEANLVTAELLSTAGWTATGLLALAVATATFAYLQRHRTTAPRAVAVGALLLATLGTADLAVNLWTLSQVGWPESILWSTYGVSAGTVAVGGVLATTRREIATGLRFTRGLTPAWSPSPQATAAVAFAVVLVVSGVGPFAGLGGMAVQDHDGVAAAAAGDEEWSFSTGGDVASSPTIVDGTVYVGSGDGNIYARDAATGNQEWSASIGDSASLSSPTVANGMVYIGSYDNFLYAFDKDTGTQEWAVDTGGAVRRSPTVVDGTVYVGNGNGDMLAYDATSGTEEWSTATGASTILSSPSVKNGLVFIGAWDGNLYAFDKDSGTEEWAGTTGDSIRSAPTVANGTAFVGSQDGSLHAFDASTGADEWSFATGGNVDSSPTVADGTVYVGSNDNSLYAVDASTGTKEWSYATGASVASSPTVADGTVYVGNDGGSLYARDAATGNQEWSSSLGATTTSSPTVADGSVFVGSGSSLFALDTGSTGTFSSGSRVNLRTLGHHDQTPLDGHPISGTVTDNGGDPVDGATVSTGTGVSTTTASDGSYELTVSEIGEYEITANAENYSASTQTVDVPDGGITGVDFSLLDAPGSVTFLGADGSEITDRQTRIELYPVNNETISEDAGFFLDDRSKEPIATGSDSSIALDEAIRGNNYVVAFRSDDSQSETTYRDAAIPVTDITQDWTVRLTGTDAVQVRVAVRDLTAAGNWSSERLHIRADAVDNTTGERTTVDVAALGSENLGTLLLPDRETLDIYAVRDDGAERYLGELNVLKEVSDETVVFDIESPESVWNDTDMRNRTTDDSPHAPGDDGGSPWSGDDDVHYPPTASVTADNSQPIAGETVTFDASGSRAYDDAVIDTYEWTLPDGSTASGETATWTPDADDAGSAHTVEVTVTDDEGTFDTTQYSVYVAEDEASRASPPVADADVATDSPTVGNPVTLESISSADDGVSIETVEWDLDADGSFDDATGDTAEIVPEEAGLREVGIRVTDSNGATDSYYISFFVGAEVEDPSSIGGGGGGSGSIGGPLGGGGGGGLGAGQQLAIGVAGLIGYWGWRRVGGPGVVSLAQRALPVARRGLSAALSGVSTVVRGTMGLLGRLLGRGGDA